MHSSRVGADFVTLPVLLLTEMSTKDIKGRYVVTTVFNVNGGFKFLMIV